MPAEKDRRGNDRRDSERRNDADPNFEGEERREGDRRQDDRRAGGDRRAPPVHGKGYYIAWGFAAGLLPAIALLLLIQWDDPSGWQRGTPRGAVNMETDERQFRPPGNPGIGMNPARPKKSDASLLTEDLLSLAPHLYNSVKLRGRKSGGATIDENDLADVEIVDVEGIEISVKAEAWDRTPPSKRVNALKRTWEFLTSRYPSLTQLVELSFDDGRPNLQLRF